MRESELPLFASAIGIKEPWKIKEMKLSRDTRELNIWLYYDQGAKFEYEGQHYAVYDHQKERTWQHMNFFEFRCYIHAGLPRVKTKDGAVRVVSAPWAAND